MTAPAGPPSTNADVDPGDGRDESDAERADRNWNEILQELRVTQTGTQIISGFLLTVAFQQRFGSLGTGQLVVYAALIALATASTVLGVSVVSLHRARFHKHDKKRIVAIANRVLNVNVWVVAILAAGVALFIFDVVFGLVAGIAAGAGAAILVAYFIVLLPRRGRPEKRGRGRDSRADGT